MFGRFALLGLSFALIGYAALSILVDTVYREDLRVESALCGTLYFCNNDLLLDTARGQLWAAGGDGIEPAVALYEESLRRNPASAARWCDLGDAYARAQDYVRAELAFANAVELAPHSPPILVRAAGYHFSRDDAGATLPLLARILDLVRVYDGIVFSYFQRLGSPVDEVLESGIPANPEAVNAYFAFVLENASPETADAIWRHPGAQPQLSVESACRYMDALLDRGDGAAARSVYRRTAGLPDADPEELLPNGDFEQAPLRTRLDWKWQSSDHVQVDRSQRAAAGGEWGMAIRFGGEANISFNQIRRDLRLAPGRYRFEAEYRATDVTTNEGVRLVFVTGTKLQQQIAEIENIRGTHEWQSLSTEIVIPAGAETVQLRLVRYPSERFNNKIGGEVHLDNFSLTVAR